MFAVRGLRLTRNIASAANKRTLSHLHLLPTTDSALKARKILEDNTLNPLVETLTIKASLEDVDYEIHPTWNVPWHAEKYPEYANEAEHGIETNGVLSVAFKAMLNDIGLFRNLRRPELKHDHEVEDTSGNARESTEYRDTFFKKVLLALNHADHPAEKLRGLSICNLPELTSYDIVKSSDFKAVLSRLDSLDLCITTEDRYTPPETEIEIVGRLFGGDLQRYWLEPLQQNLVHLKL